MFMNSLNLRRLTDIFALLTIKGSREEEMVESNANLTMKILV